MPHLPSSGLPECRTHVLHMGNRKNWICVLNPSLKQIYHRSLRSSLFQNLEEHEIPVRDRRTGLFLFGFICVATFSLGGNLFFGFIWVSLWVKGYPDWCCKHRRGHFWVRELLPLQENVYPSHPSYIPAGRNKMGNIFRGNRRGKVESRKGRINPWYSPQV